MGRRPAGVSPAQNWVWNPEPFWGPRVLGSAIPVDLHPWGNKDIRKVKHRWAPLSHMSNVQIRDQNGENPGLDPQTRHNNSFFGQLRAAHVCAMLWGLYGLGLRGGGGGGVWGPLAIWPLVTWLLVDGNWKLASGYWLWILVLVMGMGMVIDYMDRDRFGLLESGVRTSFMWVWMFGVSSFRVDF
jgi:hypothetical protein